jgi:SAM-dependent methyltransferase
VSPSDGSEREYLDVLGEREAIGSHWGQQVFRSRLLPFVYERIWRPLVARLFFFGWGVKAGAERQMTMDRLAIEPGDAVLDVGCGTGNYTRYLAAATGNGLVVGIDASEAMVAGAARRGGASNLTYLRGDASELPFRDGQFDAVCCVGVLHMLDRPQAALEEMVRVLAPRGRLVVVATCARKAGEDRNRHGITIFGREELTGALAESGLQVDQLVLRRAQFVTGRRKGE